MVVDHGDPLFIDGNIVIELCFRFVYKELVQFTGEILSVSHLAVAPTLPKGTGVTFNGIRALGS